MEALVDFLMKAVVFASATAAALAVLVLAVLRSASLQRMLIFKHWVRHPRGNLSNPQLFGLPEGRVRNVTIRTPDGVNLGAWHIVPFGDGAESANRSASSKHGDVFRLDSKSRVLLYFHGNAGNRGAVFRIETYRRLLQCAINSCSPSSQDDGFHLLVIDYRGFGDSDRSQPSESGLLTDAATAFDYLTGHGVTARRIIIIGQSLGTAVAAQLAASRPTAAGVVLVSPFTMIAEAALAYPWSRFLCSLVSLVLGEKRTFEKIKSSLCDQLDTLALAPVLPTIMPVFVLHGTLDKIVPVRHARRIATALATGSKGSSSGSGSSSGVYNKVNEKVGLDAKQRDTEPHHVANTSVFVEPVETKAAASSKSKGVLEVCAPVSGLGKASRVEYAEIYAAGHNDIYENEFAMSVMQRWIKTLSEL